MMADHFIDDEAEKFLGEVGIEVCLCRERAKPRNLALLAAWVGGRQSGLCFVGADGLGDLEPFGEHKYQCRVDIIDALAVKLQPVVRHVRISLRGLALAAPAVQRNSR